MSGKNGTNGQLNESKDKIVTSNIPFNSTATATATDGNKLDIGDFSGKGIFSPDGFLAALNSAEQSRSSSSSSRVIEGPVLTNDNDGKQYQASFVDSGAPNSIQNDKNENKNLIRLLASQEVVELNIKSRSAEEKVFSIDHILESIFSQLNQNTLLICRNVSLRWAYFASKPLHKIVHIRVTRRGQTRQRTLSRGTANADFSLQSLIALMNKSAGFPCSTFSFLNIFTADDGIINYAQPFLNTHGHCIKKVRIDGRISLEDVKRLVFTQAQNLEQLLLVNDRCSSFRDEDWSGAIVSLQPKLLNLKVFKCEEHIPKMFIQYILEWSPNLVEVVLPVKYLGLLVKPVNRLHLLKKLDTGLEYHTSIKAVECVLNQHEENPPALRNIHFHHRDDTLNARRINVMNKILKESSASCQILALDYKFDFEIPEMPQMPQVRHLSFHGSRYNLCPVNLFQKWSRLGSTFPNLRSLSINISTCCRERAEDSLYGWHVPPKIVSVKNIFLRRQMPQEDVLGRFKEIFPNAAIRDSLVAETYDADDAGLQFNLSL